MCILHVHVYNKPLQDPTPCLVNPRDALGKQGNTTERQSNTTHVHVAEHSQFSLGVIGTYNTDHILRSAVTTS